MAWADRKDAKSGIYASSARAFPGAGRFALLPMPLAFYVRCMQKNGDPEVAIFTHFSYQNL